ncbi:uncharacterized protein LOC109538912, partial [Dendroctonus ponderosae]|uniref:uncharacterized protein LOC109538912 n=1 Tax=Dendroctonus ponderosae TaxID=77166 RepID=UPI002034BE52
MDSGSSCLCESSEPTDPTEYLEILKKKYLDRTAKLQAQQQDLERKIMKMETFIGKPQGSSLAGPATCQCDSLSIPKVFPETPVRDVPAVPRTITDQQPVTQQCSFFQKMMENAKSILSMKCQCPSPGAKATSFSDSPTNTDYAQTTTTTLGSTDLTSSEIPTKETDRSAQENLVDYEETLTDKSSRTSTCTCEFTDPSTLQDFSCTCTIADGKTKVVPQSQQVSINSSSTPQSPNTQHPSSADPLTSTTSKSEKCPLKQSTTSDLISGECSCGECRCDSSLSNIDDKLNFSNIPIEDNIVIPAVSVFLNKGDKPSAEVQVATPFTSKGLQMTKDTASKCVTCCKNSYCPTNKAALSKGKTGHLAAGVQVASNTKSRGVNITSFPKNSLNVGVTCCQIKTCPNNQPKSSCNAKCSTMPLPDLSPSSGKETVMQACECDLNGLTQTGQERQDGQNQCAFIGSPLLDFNDMKRSSGKVLCDCNTDQGPNKVCEISGYSLTSNDILEMQNIAELAKKEKAMKVQIEELQRREKQYQEATRNVENLVTKAKTSCCSCHGKAGPPNISAEIDKISRELRLENQILKAELQDMKLELKHCLEKVEGPMKLKLETEKQKCECLQQDLQMASKNMLVNQDAYSREMNQLKLQLCCACTNITELNQMNQRLKDEMSQLDCLCQKLEDDLIKQKVNEAETIKRLTSRKNFSGKSEEFKCDSNLDVIARKLSKTIKDLAPCEECSKLPAELAGAAKCIRDLTDMVRKRKTKSSTVSGCCCNAPLKPIPKKVKEEECCSCCGPTDGAGESLEQIAPVADKNVKTLHGVPQSFAQNDESSRFDVGGVQSSYYSAKGEPGREAPCATIGQPCFQSKSTLTKPLDDPLIENKLPCSDIGEPCRDVEKAKLQDRLVQVPAGIDKGCRAPCSEMMEPVKDPQVELALKGEKDSEEKPVQVPEETPSVEQNDGLQAAIQDQAKDAGDVVAEDSSEQQNVTEITYGVVEEVPRSKFAIVEEGNTTESAPDISDGYLSSGPATDATTPEDESKPSDGLEGDDGLDETEQPPEGGVQLKTLPADLLEVAEEISAGKFEESDAEDGHGGVAIGQREIPFDEKRYGGEVPVDVENRAFGLDEGPADLHMTTTVTSSGTLEVVTEGPGGTIGTTLTYTEEGNIEVVTEMTDNFGGPGRMLDKFATKPLSEGIPFRSNDAIPCAPSATCETMEPVAGYEVCEPTMICHNLDNAEKGTLKALPVASSMISGPSGPETETPYTASTTTAEGELTSKLGSGSSGIRPQFDRTPDQTSSYGRPGVAMEEPLEELQEPVDQHSEQLAGDPSGKASSREIGVLSSGARATGADSTTGREGLPSEGTTSTAGELKSGEVFTPDQVGSDLEEAFVASKSLQGTDIGAGVGAGAVEPTVSGGADGRSAEAGGIATILKNASQGGAEPKESEIGAVKASGVFTAGGVAQSVQFGQKGSKPDEGAPDTTPLPVTDSTGINWTRECACQSKDQTDQSCQCCECKTIGVTTSGDKETLTEKDEEMCKIPQETLDGAKTDTDSEFVTISETTDHAFAEVPSETKPEPQDAVEVPSKSSSPFGDNIISKEIVITEDLLKRYPQLATLSAPSQQQALQKLGIKQSLKEAIVVDRSMLEKHPELIGKSPEEQQSILKTMGYKPSKAIEPDIAVDEDKLAKHPELVGRSNSEQQRILQSLGYKPALIVAVDDEILQKHPELADKTPEEQQSLLRELGYATSSPSKAIPAEDDVQLRQIDYDTLQPSTSKVAPSTDEFNVPPAITEQLLAKHPQLAGKTTEDQQKILRDLGYSLPKESLLQTVSLTKEMLENHPELQGKPSAEQQKILKSLGYTKKQSTVSFSKDLTAKHPELQGKSVAEQREILKTLGYNGDDLRPGLSATKPEAIPGAGSATAKAELLLKHPELEGKSSAEQREILKNLGYSAAEAQSLTEELPQKPSELLGKSASGVEAPAEEPELPSKISRAILEAHPELAGKPVEEQKKILAQMGYTIEEVIEKSESKKISAEAFESARDVLEGHKSDAPFSTPQPSSFKDVSVTGKAPSQAAAVPSDFSKKSSAVMDKLTPEPSSKDVSISCRAPCRSAATIHSPAPKDSDQNIAHVGDVSSASLTKSRTVSLQKKPSSRDDSASCKASCRAISVQSHGSKSSKDVKEIVAARSDTTTTSSSSDARLKAKSKKDKMKEHPGEVPSIVSQLSDKERPVPGPTAKKPRNHRKRRAKAIDCMRCVCPDPCKCAVCTADKKKQALSRPARSCDCPPNMFMVPPIMMMSPMQMTYSMPPTGHAPNCRCNACICRDMLPKPEVDSKPEAESATSDDTEATMARQLRSHPSSCECVDCLCLPKVHKLARTKEYPIVHDTKQVYQVKVNCGTCANAQNARRYVEQQQQLNRSRIPISTTSPNPPRVKSNPEQNIASPDKGEASQPEASGVSAVASTYNSISCDCARCACADCPDDAKRPPKPEACESQAKTNADAKGGQNCCCPNVPCSCQPCTVEELTRKLRDAEQKLANASPSGAPPPPGSAPLEKPAEEDTESCNCVECVCPGADSMPAKALPAGEGPPAETPKPQSDDSGAVASPDAAGAPAAAGAGDEDCNCNVCACPGSTSLPPKSGPDSKPVAMEVCDCQVCKCSPCADPQKKTDARDQIAAAGVADCDCIDCKCDPCADPKKQKSSQNAQQGESAAGRGDVEVGKHGENCDCPECICPGADSKMKPVASKASKFTDMPEKIPHPPDCDCDECLCLEEIIQTELVDKLEKGVQPAPVEKEVHAVNCTCIECLCPECSTETIHGPNCKCIDCVCDPCDKKGGDGKVAAVKSAVQRSGEAGDHPAGCTCIVCKCDVCNDPTKKSEVKVTIGDQPHGDDCKCLECVCKECLIKLAPLKHEDGCQCAQCVCVECLKKMQEGDATIAPKSAPDDLARGADTGNR